MIFRLSRETPKFSVSYYLHFDSTDEINLFFAIPVRQGLSVSWDLQAPRLPIDI